MFRAGHNDPTAREIVTMNLVRIAASAFALATLSAAAPAADAPQPVGAEPQTTSASYGDWILRCSRGADGKRACEVEQPFQVQVQGQQAPFGQLAIGHQNGTGPMHITFIMSPNVSFPSDVRLMTDEKDAQPIVLSWSNCVPAACRSDGEFKDDQLKRWKALTANGRLVFKTAAGQPFPITVSVRGLAPALDALAKD
ncbi:MAG TPA: invasion associated locus B family protein [Alphaproteobacteria bacterium]|jgi:invasion protein IalB|nr:invasion associated locus B family protein [Alphaproteobacteria bacterium]